MMMRKRWSGVSVVGKSGSGISVMGKSGSGISVVRKSGGSIPMMGKRGGGISESWSGISIGTIVGNSDIGFSNGRVGRINRLFVKKYEMKVLKCHKSKK